MLIYNKLTITHIVKLEIREKLAGIGSLRLNKIYSREFGKADKGPANWEITYRLICPLYMSPANIWKDTLNEILNGILNLFEESASDADEIRANKGYYNLPAWGSSSIQNVVTIWSSIHLSWMVTALGYVTTQTPQQRIVMEMGYFMMIVPLSQSLYGKY